MTVSFWRRALVGVAALAMLAALGMALREEIITSRLQARLLSGLAGEMGFTLADGPNPDARFPAHGPYNDRLGYSALPRFLKALDGEMYAVEMQARPSPTLATFMGLGGFPVYHEKTRAGLTIRDRAGVTMHAARAPERVFERFAEVPPVVAATLLFIENRELLDEREPRRNPAVEWDRFAAALLALPMQWVHPGSRSPGGSTLATQIEKYRHSPDGQTASGGEKLRQMVSASVRAYLDGEDTRPARERIVVDYLNSTPLTARAGFGEVNGLGDGLWAWYGTDLTIANRILSEPARDARSLQLKALAYKQVLSLLLAQRRPSHYLIADRGALERLCDSYLGLLRTAGIIDRELHDEAMEAPLRFSDELAPAQSPSFVEQKAANAIRARLLSMLGVTNFYALDRLDLTVDTTLDSKTQARVAETLGRLNDPAAAREFGLTGEHMLDAEGGDLSKVIYSFTLYERGPDANVLRVQADNLDQPLDINEGAKLDLGSTAKLRTLATYLEIIAELHARYAHLPRDVLRDVEQEAPDNLTRWATGWLVTARDRALTLMLDAAMERRYSANPNEAFFTGGGMHSFVNFNPDDNGRILTVTQAIRNSVNLPFIRIMRDIVRFHMADGGDDGEEVLDNPDHPSREAYLAHFADREGSDYLNRFFNIYHKRTAEEALNLIVSRTRPQAQRLAAVFRQVRPNADLEEFSAFLDARLPDADLDDDHVARLYQEFAPERSSLKDRAYAARLHPLELWLVGWLQTHPAPKRADVLEASADARQESYRWLFQKNRNTQNTRIRIGLEEEAFQHVTEAWRRLGYPFETLVPSLATAIGSSADRPAALAELVGIILNDGVRQPTVRVKRLHFAADTPFETVVGLGAMTGRRVLRREICQTLRKALLEVTQNGTARRISGVFKDADGHPLAIGGKTGTGDHRLDRWGPGGRLLESRAVNRTATFVFFIGEHFFGTMTAFVHGGEADRYHFTSSLPVQLLKGLAPALQPLIAPATTDPATSAAAPTPAPKAEL